jgi:hypothetical protein
MSSDSSIVDLGELSKPATVLIEKISDAVGGLFKPYQIVRVAKAEAEAERVRAESQIQISDLQRRAFYRFLEEEARKQKNIEEITRQALPQLDDKSKPEQLEDDWITNFFDKCRLISDSEMQSLWSRILAGEANAPGSYTKRTVNFVSSLDKSDAQLFTNLCKFGWMIRGFHPLIYDVQAEIYNKNGINFVSLSHLESIGLIQFDNLGGYSWLKLPKKIAVVYYGTPTVLEFEKETENAMKLGHTLFTKIGEELAPICGSQPDAEFHEYVLNKWKEMGYIKEKKAEPSSEADG